MEKAAIMAIGDFDSELSNICGLDIGAAATHFSGGRRHQLVWFPCDGPVDPVLASIVAFSILRERTLEVAIHHALLNHGNRHISLS